MGIITDLGEALIDDDTVVKQFEISGTAYYDKKERYTNGISAYDTTTHPGKFQPEIGDVVMYDINSRNELTALAMILDMSEIDNDPTGAFKAGAERVCGDVTSDPRVSFVDVYDRYGNYIAVTTKDLSNFDGKLAMGQYYTEYVGGLTANNIYMYDTDSKKIFKNELFKEATITLDSIYDYTAARAGRSRLVIFDQMGYSNTLIIIN